jgi:hypothetical protein
MPWELNNIIVTEWPLGSQIMLIYTTDWTVESNTEHLTRIQELFFPVNSVLTQSVLQAHSPNAGPKTQYCSTQTQPPFTLCSSFLDLLSPTHYLASWHKILFSSTSTQHSHSSLISCLSHTSNIPRLFKRANYTSYLLLVLVHSKFMMARLYGLLR